ncbi:MAG: DEAD/DEAH box helicase [Lentisphaeria bacterium]|nr:DEAD/DEAH box helicase [Lentisphaeria bacterium]
MRVAAGARVVIRDAEWLVKTVDRTSTGTLSIRAVGISELVRGREAIFLEDLESWGDGIEVLDPAAVRLVPDPSPHYRNSMLYIESLLRQTPPTDPPAEEKIYLGHKAAMDAVPYQLDPAMQALKQPRQRILIADAVGLGKTLEAGVLLTELIRRGKGRRILVVALKSMLTQFQKEMWARFSIGLTRLDSVGIQRVKQQIPANHNPFYFFDRSIISIDTLKQDSEYRPYIENCHWDVIIIDEAHNVAERGSHSLRARLAKLLSSRSDTLIMLSATPHDGRKESFASLMNMLDPTAIANPEDYGPEDIKGLFIRRFKKDIQHQVRTAFMDRTIRKEIADAGPSEESAFDQLTSLKFKKLDRRGSGNRLFRTTLEKALFSSPAACLETANHRIKNLEASKTPEAAEDISQLRDLVTALEGIGPKQFSKYQALVKLIRDKQEGFGWSGRDATDRLVIFTERIETLKFLCENLKKDLKLKDKQVEILHGTLSDVDQQRVVEAFGQEESPVRILIASDLAAEGINLHYLSHRLVHFDIPWSLMVFQQRNGRVDRYGQTQQPEIAYLMTRARNPDIKGDMRILEVLIEKDQQAYKNIGDPSAFMREYDVDREEERTAAAMEADVTAEEFDASLEAGLADDPLAILLGEDEEPPTGQAAESTHDLPSIFNSDYDYAKAAANLLREGRRIDGHFDDAQQFITLNWQEDFTHCMRDLPQEVRAEIREETQVIVTTDRQRLKNEMVRCRKEEHAWPRFSLLWDLHPVMDWFNNSVLTVFGRHEAPVIHVPKGLQPGQTLFLMTGLIPNRKSQPLIHRWFGLLFSDGKTPEILFLDQVINLVGLGFGKIPNPGKSVDSKRLAKLLPRAVDDARQWMSASRDEFHATIQPLLDKHMAELKRLKGDRMRQLELDFGDATTTSRRQASKKEARQREIDTVFAETEKWIADTMTTEDDPYIRVVAAFVGGA